MVVVWYVLMVLGIFIQGEAAVFAACVGAVWGDLFNVPIALLAAIGAFLADWLYFTLGRRYGAKLVARYRWLQGRLDKTSELLAKKPVWTILILRSQIGMRILGHFLLGAGEIDQRRYLEVNALASLIWGLAVTILCFYFLVYTEPIWQMLIDPWL